MRITEIKNYTKDIRPDLTHHEGECVFDNIESLYDMRPYYASYLDINGKHVVGNMKLTYTFVVDMKKEGASTIEIKSSCEPLYLILEDIISCGDAKNASLSNILHKQVKVLTAFYDPPVCAEGSVAPTEQDLAYIRAIYDVISMGTVDHYITHDV